MKVFVRLFARNVLSSDVSDDEISNLVGSIRDEGAREKEKCVGHPRLIKENDFANYVRRFGYLIKSERWRKRKEIFFCSIIITNLMNCEIILIFLLLLLLCASAQTTNVPFAFFLQIVLHWRVSNTRMARSRSIDFYSRHLRVETVERWRAKRIFSFFCS